MAKEEERTPQEWRELLRTSYDYPEEIEEAPRRKRRRLRRAHRNAERERTAQWISEQRRRDPLRPGAALVIVAAVLLAGTAARYGPSLFGGGDDRGRNVTATASPSRSTDQGAEADSSPSPSASASPSPSASASPSPSASVDLSKPDTVAKEWARLYLTRNPPVDTDHTAAVRRAAPYSMPALTENLANSSDPAWNRLVSNGGVSAVGAVTVKPAGGKLPPDTPLRVWRTVTATVKVDGYTKYTEKTVIQTELTNTGDGWLVSRVVGV